MLFKTKNIQDILFYLLFIVIHLSLPAEITKVFYVFI